MVSLKKYNTFGIDARAAALLLIRSQEELEKLMQSKLLAGQPYLILGGGSNMVFEQDYPGLVVHLETKGIAAIEEQGDDIVVEAQAGEVWDHFVRTCTENGWHGAENLAAIPGTVGASPVQNVGAYGLEAKDIIDSVTAYCIATGEARQFSNAECHFGYRNSIFKNELKGQYLVAAVRYRLHRTFTPNLTYKALATALEQAEIACPTPLQMVETVTRLRDSKLPNPQYVGSAGSFFKNPIVDADCYQRLLAQYPDMPAYPAGERYKLAAGWMIEKAGWKGRDLGPAGVYEKQALVLVNRGGCTGADVRRLANAVTDDVERLFGVRLEAEAIFI